MDMDYVTLQIILAWSIVISAIVIIILLRLYDNYKRRRWKALGYIRVIDLNNSKLWLSRLYYSDKDNTYYVRKNIFAKKILIPKPNADTIVLFQKDVKEFDPLLMTTKDITVDYEKLIKLKLMSALQGVFFTKFMYIGIIIGIAIGIFAGMVIAPFIMSHYPIFPQQQPTTTTSPITITR
jgi:hypothetical protein